jgi:hypothetical protein
MSSVRVPRDLLERLNEAAPEGTPLHEVIETLLDEAGGPAAVREKLERRNRRAEPKARLARERGRRLPSDGLDGDEQVALAEAAGRWCRTLEEDGQRAFDPDARRLDLTPRALPEDAGSAIRPRGRFARAGDEP